MKVAEVCSSIEIDIDEAIYHHIMSEVLALTTLSPVQARWIATFLADRGTSEMLKTLAPVFVKLGGPKMDGGFTTRKLGRAVKAYQKEVQNFYRENPDASDRDAFLYLCGLRKSALS